MTADMTDWLLVGLILTGIAVGAGALSWLLYALLERAHNAICRYRNRR